MCRSGLGSRLHLGRDVAPHVLGLVCHGRKAGHHGQDDERKDEAIFHGGRCTAVMHYLADRSYKGSHWGRFFSKGGGKLVKEA